MRLLRAATTPARHVSAIRARLRLERGQVLWTAALLLPVMLGMAGIAADVGAYAAERRSLQNAADSIALAAGQGLPDETMVRSIADQWALKNDVDPAQMSVSVSGGTTSPAVTVTITERHEFAFMRVVGVSEKDVGARAVAGKFSAGGGSGVVPWTITEETLDATDSGELVTIKLDAGSAKPGPGNFGVIRIDGNGASDYEDAAKWGADSVICSQGTPLCDSTACPGTYPATCAENAPECDGQYCTPNPGNMTGPTRDAVDFRVDNTMPSCDEFDEVFTPVTASLQDVSQDLLVSAQGFGPRHHGKGSHPTFTPTPAGTDTPVPTPTHTRTPTNTPVPGAPTDTPSATPTAGSATATSTPGGSDSQAKYSLNPACNPWGGGGCPPAPATTPCSRRVFLVPIVDGFGNGSSADSIILGFALVFLEGYENGKCSGNDCEVNARFVRAEVTTGAFAGNYDEDSPLQFVKLIE